MPGSLYGQAQRPLVFGADPCAAPWFYLGPIGDKASDAFHVFIVYFFDMLDAKAADPAARWVSATPSPSEPPSLSGSTGTAGTSRRLDLGGMLAWEQPWSEPWRELLIHAKVKPYLDEILGTGYRLDHGPGLIAMDKGCEGGMLVRPFRFFRSPAPTADRR